MTHCLPMSDSELDEVLTFRWPLVVRRVMADGSDDWLKGFVLSITRHARRPQWRPSPKQERIMRDLLSDLGDGSEPDFNPIED